MPSSAKKKARVQQSRARKFSVEVARKKNCEILGISASRAHKKQCLNSASVRYVNQRTSSTLERVFSAFKCEKSASPASTSRKFCAKIARKNCKIFGNPARLAHKSCVHPAGMRCAYCTTLLKWNESAVRADPKKRTSRSRTLCAKIARKNCNFAKFPKKIWRAARTEVACTQQA